eukprot:gene5605-19227_t
MAEEQAPADLALALKTHARLFDHLRRRQASIHALRAYHADNATMLQHLEVCLEDGINYKVNVACSQSGFTPIFAACLQGDPTAVKMLLAFGADAVAEMQYSLMQDNTAVQQFADRLGHGSKWYSSSAATESARHCYMQAGNVRVVEVRAVRATLSLTTAGRQSTSVDGQHEQQVNNKGHGRPPIDALAVLARKPTCSMTAVAKRWQGNDPRTFCSGAV